MNNFEYINLPKIPDELIPELYQSIKDDDVRQSYIGYTLYHFKPNLKQFILNLFGEGFTCAIQVIAGEQPIHIDYGREVAHNYIIDLGGEHVTTSFYKDLTGLDKLENICIEPHRWHKLNVSVPHGVEGIITKRISITAWQRVFKTDN